MNMTKENSKLIEKLIELLGIVMKHQFIDCTVKHSKSKKLTPLEINWDGFLVQKAYYQEPAKIYVTGGQVAIMSNEKENKENFRPNFIDYTLDLINLRWSPIDLVTSPVKVESEFLTN